MKKKVKKEFKIKVKLKYEDKDNVTPHDEITDTSNLEPNTDILKIRIFFFDPENTGNNGDDFRQSLDNWHYRRTNV